MSSAHLAFPPEIPGTPYYAHLESPQMVDELRQEVSVVPPDQIENYKRLESTVSAAFTRRFGKYLTDAQLEYWNKPEILFTDPVTSAHFIEHWHGDVQNTNLDDTPIEGLTYIGYSTGLPVLASELEGQMEENSGYQPEDGAAVQHWAGRFATYPLTDQEIRGHVSPDSLMSEADMSRKVFREDAPASLLESFVYSTNMGAIIVHEKVHGIQDPPLPLPIQEAAATYYERETFQGEGWDWSRGRMNNMKFLADLYAECIEDYGPDIHRLIFGNLDGVEREKALVYLKSRFTVAEIEKLSLAGEMPYRYIHWDTIAEAA